MGKKTFKIEIGKEYFAAQASDCLLHSVWMYITWEQLSLDSRLEPGIEYPPDITNEKYKDKKKEVVKMFESDVKNLFADYVHDSYYGMAFHDELKQWALEIFIEYSNSFHDSDRKEIFVESEEKKDCFYELSYRFYTISLIYKYFPEIMAEIQKTHDDINTEMFFKTLSDITIDTYSTMGSIFSRWEFMIKQERKLIQMGYESGKSRRSELQRRNQRIVEKAHQLIDDGKIRDCASILSTQFGLSDRQIRKILNRNKIYTTQNQSEVNKQTQKIIKTAKKMYADGRFDHLHKILKMQFDLSDMQIDEIVTKHKELILSSRKDSE